MRLARLMRDADHHVYVLRRSAVQEEGIHGIQADVMRPETLQLPEQLDYVFVTLEPQQSGEAAYRQLYFEGTKNLMQALHYQPLKRLFWVSSSSVWGEDDGQWVDENTPVSPQTATARVLCDSERLLEKAPWPSVWPSTVVRFSGIYGPGRLRLLRWVQEGRPVQADPPAWTNRIHVDDCASLLFFLFVRDVAGTPLDAVYVGTDNVPCPQHEILDWLADQMGLPHVSHQHRLGEGSNKRLSNQRLIALGYQFHYPDYQSGYRAIMASAPRV
jgi:nucleoside-diphosphate-sugar epimerase